MPRVAEILSNFSKITWNMRFTIGNVLEGY